MLPPWLGILGGCLQAPSRDRSRTGAKRLQALQGPQENAWRPIPTGNLRPSLAVEAALGLAEMCREHRHDFGSRQTAPSLQGARDGAAGGGMQITLDCRDHIPAPGML